MTYSMRSLICLAAALTTVAALPAQTEKTSGTKARGDAVFKQLIERYYSAWNTANPDNAAPLYAPEAGLVFYDLAPLKYNGWGEYKEGAAKLLSQFAGAKLTPNDDLKVTRHGKLAWTTVTFHLSGTLKTGAAMELDGRHTAIWEKRGDKWLIVHEHVSAPLPG